MPSQPVPSFKSFWATFWDRIDKAGSGGRVRSCSEGSTDTAGYSLRNRTSGTLRHGVVLQPQFSRRTLPAELGASNAAAHRGRTAMPGVTHDCFVRHAVAIGGRHAAGAEAMWAERFRRRACQAGLRRIHSRLQTAARRNCVARTGAPANGSNPAATTLIAPTTTSAML